MHEKLRMHIQEMLVLGLVDSTDTCVRSGFHPSLVALALISNAPKSRNFRSFLLEGRKKKLVMTNQARLSDSRRLTGRGTGMDSFSRDMVRDRHV